MPTQLSISPFGGLNPQPTIIPQSEGAREEARIKRLLDLAKLEQLRREPQFEQRRLNLADQQLLQAWESMKGQQSIAERQLAETSKFHTTTTDIDREQLAETARYNTLQDQNADLDRGETSRFHTMGDQRAKEGLGLQRRGQDTNLTQTLISSLGDDPRMMDILATTLSKRGIPELAEALKGQKDQLTAREIARLEPQMKALDPKSRSALLYTESQKNPDVGAALQMLYPDLAPVVPGAKKSKGKEALKMFLTGGASHYPEVYKEFRSLFAN